LPDEGWTEEELDLRHRVLVGETVVYNVSTAKKAPHRRFHEWAEAHGHAQAREAVIIGPL